MKQSPELDRILMDASNSLTLMTQADAEVYCRIFIYPGNAEADAPDYDETYSNANKHRDFMAHSLTHRYLSEEEILNALIEFASREREQHPPNFVAVIQVELLLRGPREIRAMSAYTIKIGCDARTGRRLVVKKERNKYADTVFFLSRTLQECSSAGVRTVSNPEQLSFTTKETTMKPVRLTPDFIINTTTTRRRRT
jgi:hypothetical protein